MLLCVCVCVDWHGGIGFDPPAAADSTCWPVRRSDADRVERKSVKKDAGIDLVERIEECVHCFGMIVMIIVTMTIKKDHLALAAGWSWCFDWSVCLSVFAALPVAASVSLS